jgi:hypothetical protein
VAFPSGTAVTLGQFAKDLKSFSLWSGTTIATGSGACRSSVTLRIPDATRFLHSLPSCHYVLVYGEHEAALTDILLRMNVQTVGPMVYRP